MPFGPDEEERLAKGENLKPGESRHILTEFWDWELLIQEGLFSQLN